MIDPVSFPFLVVPDVHTRVEEAESLVARYASDGRPVVFLGDYFDSYTTGPLEAHLTARWLRRSLERPNRIHLLGNHDVSYFFQDHPQASCFGWSEECYRAIQTCLGDVRAVASKLHLAVNAGPWLLSHAGFSGRQFRGAPRLAMLAWAEAAKAALLSGGTHPLLGVGLVRGGSDKRGGILWCDFDDEFAAIPGIHQIVGHTRSSSVVRCRQLLESGSIGYGEIGQTGIWGRLPDGDKAPWRSVNWCMDVDLDACATVTSDEIVVHFDGKDLRFPAPSETPAGIEEFPLIKAAGLPIEWGLEPPAYVPWAAIGNLVSDSAFFSSLKASCRKSLHLAGPNLPDLERSLRSLIRQGWNGLGG